MADHATNRRRLAEQMADRAVPPGFEVSDPGYLRFLVANAGLDWFVEVARQVGRPGCSPETAEHCRSILLERLASR